MSLKDKANSMPAFESEDETNSDVSVAVAEPVQTQALVQEQPQVAAPAVVKPTAVVAAAAKFVPAFSDMNLALPIEMVEQLSLGAPRIKGEQGSAYLGDEEVGKVFRAEVVSFNSRWAIGTGNEKQGVEDKEAFRVSYDGKHIAGEETTVDAYLAELKAKGFHKAKKSPYIDLWVFVTHTEKKGDIAIDERQLTLVQLSQTSAGNWANFCASRGMLESRGAAKLVEVEIVAQAQTNGSNKYTNFQFRAPKA